MNSFPEGGKNVEVGDTFFARGFFVGQSGTVIVRCLDDSEITINNAFGFFPFYVKEFLPGTTAENLIICK